MEQDHPCRNHHRIGGLDGDSDMEEREMTVSELIDALKEMPQEREVRMVISCFSYDGDAKIQIDSEISGVNKRKRCNQKYVASRGY